MDLTHWRPGRDIGPWRRLREIEDEMESLVGRLFGREPGFPRESIWAPVVDVKETRTDVVVKAELPEIDPREMEITVDGKLLTIKGERKSEEEKKEGNYCYSERKYGSFVRSLTLPQEVDETRTKAAYKDGVVTITLPKIKKEKTKQVKVEVE